jgi:Asp-tRNA(Asn)/Glu-tRNA(Gln) amidotransferase A subunit family amidase
MQHDFTAGGHRPISAYTGASEDVLRDMLRRHAELAQRLDSHLHALEGGVDAGAAERRIDELFTRFPDPAARPPLFGVPVGVKDIIRVHGAAIRCGSLLPPVLFEGEEARCVRMLRDAGAVIFARTATTEFAYFEPAATRNPHNPAHTPGGSSSGSAAGVAAGFFPLALGTQTVGSVIRPASFCGVVGVKPSFGRIPTDGLVYFSRSVDHIGFFCGSAVDIDPVMAALDAGWSPCDTSGKLRAAVPVGPYLAQVPGDAMARFEAAVRVLEAGGVEVVRVDCLDDIDGIARNHSDLIAAEVALEHADWFAGYSHLYREKTAEIIRRGQEVSPARRAEAGRSCEALRREMAGIMDRHGLDLWICPSTLGEAPAGLHGTGSPAMNLPWTHAGMPAVSLPCGRGQAGLPLGLQCVGRYWGDAALAGAAAVIENILRGGLKP